MPITIIDLAARLNERPEDLMARLNLIKRQAEKNFIPIDDVNSAVDSRLLSSLLSQKAPKKKISLKAKVVQRSEPVVDPEAQSPGVEKAQDLNQSSDKTAEPSSAKKAANQKEGSVAKATSVNRAKVADIAQPVTQSKFELENLKNEKRSKDLAEIEAQRSRKVLIESKQRMSQTFSKPVDQVAKKLKIAETTSISDLANKLSTKVNDLIKKMHLMGIEAHRNQMIDQDTACLVVEELGHIAQPVKDGRDFEFIEQIVSQQSQPKKRPPVVTIMGHVDHGKTTLLDAVRKSQVVDGESGGITQHLGAYQVKTSKGVITFLDTPGHQAFTEMRSRGAKLTDIVVLVVAADDGVKPQTEEAIRHAQAAEVPIIVAVNKIDKEGAKADQVKRELSDLGLVAEDWGGEVLFQEISAKKNTGIDHLLDSILLQSEMLSLEVMSKGPAKGIVLESKLSKQQGVITSLLVQSGALKQGDVILAGQEYGKIRAMSDDHGNRLKQAGPSMPVEVLGLSGIPSAGDIMLVIKNEKQAKDIAVFHQQKNQNLKRSKMKTMSFEEVIESQKEDKPILNIVFKADAHGSVEAIRHSLNQLDQADVEVNLVMDRVGGISTSDVNLAVVSNALLVGFNVRADSGAKKMIQDHGLKVYYFSIIYDLIEMLESSIKGLTPTKFKESIIGLAEVRQVFRASKFGVVSGAFVQEGLIKASASVRVLRDNRVIHEGKIDSLRRVKDEVSEVKSGTDCGIGIINYKDIQVGDQIEAFVSEQV
ncbi:translation initiation factor IF-2 [Gammaproteobacteria bacterium]|nr:translation initiation factor IF-2 [Gammaproteobacteria bacterium]